MHKRYRLSHTMHVRIMGPFMNLRNASTYYRGATLEALQNRGLLDDKFKRTAAAMQYIQELCNSRDQRLQQRYPGVPLIHDDFGLYQLYKAHHTEKRPVSIYVYAGHQPLIVIDGNGQQPIGLMSSFFMWKIEVGKESSDQGDSECEAMAGSHLAKQALHRQTVGGHKGSYCFDIKHQMLMDSFAQNTSAVVI